MKLPACAAATTATLTFSWHLLAYLIGHPALLPHWDSLIRGAHHAAPHLAAAVTTSARAGRKVLTYPLPWFIRVANALVLILGALLQDSVDFTLHWGCVAWQRLRQAMVDAPPPVGGPVAVLPPAPGRFVLVARTNADECDEYYLAAPFPVPPGALSREWVALTTQDDPPYHFLWRILELREAGLERGGYTVIPADGDQREAPPQVLYPVNWICAGENLVLWNPDAAQTGHILAAGGSTGERGPAGANPAGRLRPASARPDHTGFAPSDGRAGRDAGGKYPGTARGAHASVAGCIGAAASHGGRCSSADPAPVPLATVPLAVGPVLPTATPDAAGGMAAPAPGGAAGSALGFAAPAVNAGGNLSAELEALRNIMDELKIDKKGEKKRHRRKSSRDRKDGSRHKRKKRSASPAKKKKKDTKSSSSSSSSSSGGSSDSEDSGDKHLPWVPGKSGESRRTWSSTRTPCASSGAAIC